MTAQPRTTPSAVDVSTRLAYERTFLAHERTLMAWVGAASSLITFGFSIYKFFHWNRGLGVKSFRRLRSSDRASFQITRCFMPN